MNASSWLALSDPGSRHADVPALLTAGAEPLAICLQAASLKLLSAAPIDTGPDAHPGMSTPAVAEQAAAFNNADFSSG